MKIKKPRHTKSILVTSVLIVAAGGYGAYAYSTDLWPFLPTKVIPMQSQDSDSSDKDNSNVGNSDQNTGQIPAKQTPKQYETPDSDKPSAYTLTGTLNANIAGSKLQIRVTIAQLLDNGTCQLTLTNKSSGDVVTRKADTINNPSSASCKGWDVPLNELSAGTWNVDILVTSGDKSGHITGEVNT